MISLWLNLIYRFTLQKCECETSQYITLGTAVPPRLWCWLKYMQCIGRCVFAEDLSTFLSVCPSTRLIRLINSPVYCMSGCLFVCINHPPRQKSICSGTIEAEVSRVRNKIHWPTERPNYISGLCIWGRTLQTLRIVCQLIHSYVQQRHRHRPSHK